MRRNYILRWNYTRWLSEAEDRNHSKPLRSSELVSARTCVGTWPHCQTHSLIASKKKLNITQLNTNITSSNTTVLSPYFRVRLAQ